MALNPNIILSGQQLDVLGPIQQGLRSREQFDQAPFRNQLLEQGVQQGQQRVDINDQTIRKQALEQQLFGARKAISAHDEQGEFGGPNAAGVIDGIREGFKGDEDRVKAEILEYQQDPFAYISNAKNEVDAYDAQIGRNQQKTGLASAKTEIFDNGTVVNALPDGTTQVSNPAGEIVTGDEREKVLKAARTEQIGFAGMESKSSAIGKGEGELVTKPITEAAVVKAKAVEELARDEKKQTQQINTKRLADLSQGSKTRSANTSKARRFLKALQSGEAGSGASRSAASFVPGVFTSQAEFDEKFNAFSEVAAREQLKASGELRPTDADVEGMKRAMFGIGRDENTNIQLLSEFISSQEDVDDEMQELSEAKDIGGLGTFTGQNIRKKKSRLEELRAKAGFK